MTLRGEGGFAQTVRVPSYGGWPNRHITFIVAEKVVLALFTVYGGGGGGEKGLVDNVIWGGRV